MTTSHRAWRAYASRMGRAPARHALPISTTCMDATLTVALALGRCCIWLRDMIKPHKGDEARMEAAEAIVRQIERSNFR